MGQSFKNSNYGQEENRNFGEKDLSIILKIISFIMPLVGFIIGLLKVISDKPKQAKTAVIMAFMGIGTFGILAIISFIIQVVLA